MVYHECTQAVSSTVSWCITSTKFVYCHIFISVVCHILCTDAVLKLGTDFACSICKMWTQGGAGGGSCHNCHPPNRIFNLLQCFITGIEKVQIFSGVFNTEVSQYAPVIE